MWIHVVDDAALNYVKMGRQALTNTHIPTHARTVSAIVLRRGKKLNNFCRKRVTNTQRTRGTHSHSCTCRMRLDSLIRWILLLTRIPFYSYSFCVKRLTDKPTNTPDTPSEVQTLKFRFQPDIPDFKVSFSIYSPFKPNALFEFAPVCVCVQRRA